MQTSPEQVFLARERKGKRFSTALRNEASFLFKLSLIYFAVTVTQLRSHCDITKE